MQVHITNCILYKGNGIRKYLCYRNKKQKEILILNRMQQSPRKAEIRDLY